MAGIRAAVGERRIVVINGHVSGDATAALQIGGGVFPFPAGHIISVVASIGAAGSGTGGTTLDIYKDGTTIYSTTGNRPYLAAASTGEMANKLPDTIGVVAGERITWVVAAACGTNAHTKVAATCVIEVD